MLIDRHKWLWAVWLLVEHAESFADSLVYAFIDKIIKYPAHDGLDSVCLDDAAPHSNLDYCWSGRLWSGRAGLSRDRGRRRPASIGESATEDNAHETVESDNNASERMSLLIMKRQMFTQSSAAHYIVTVIGGRNSAATQSTTLSVRLCRAELG